MADPLVPHGSSDWFVVVDHSILYPTDSSTPSSPSALGDELRRLVDSSCQLLRDAPTTPQPVRAYEPSMPIEIFAASCSKPKASSSGKHRRKRPQALPAANTIVASRSSATRRRDVFAGTIRNSDGLPRPPDASHTSTHPDGTPWTVHTFRHACRLTEWCSPRPLVPTHQTSTRRPHPLLPTTARSLCHCGDRPTPTLCPMAPPHVDFTLAHQMSVAAASRTRRPDRRHITPILCRL